MHGWSSLEVSVFGIISALELHWLIGSDENVYIRLDYCMSRTDLMLYRQEQHFLNAEKRD
jgi:hypothetical protein